MQKLEWRFADKSKWGRGPWQHEPDKMQWTDQRTGLPCLIVRSHLGTLCGYVGVPAGHRFYSKDYDDDDVGNIEFRPHGGLTYAGRCQENDREEGVCHIVDEGESDDVWWLGFDCGHAGDYWPLYARTKYCLPAESQPELYKDVEYVMENCRLLAKAVVGD